MEVSLKPRHGQRLKRLGGLLRLRCPRCLEGSIFQGWITMRAVCPVCDFHYGREEGYFSGAMDLSFFLAAPALAFVFLVLYQLFSATWSLLAILVTSYVVFLPFVPPVFRYSRVLWLYIDWQLDPVPIVKPAPPSPILQQAWLMPSPHKSWTHDSLFALAQRLATQLDPAFNRTLARRTIDLSDDHVERAAWGTEQLGLLGERAYPLPGEDRRRWQAFSAYGLPEDRAVTVRQEWPVPTAEAQPRVIVQVNATSEVLAQIDRMLMETYDARTLLRESAN